MIGDAAQIIQDRCKIQDGHSWYYGWVAGQVFMEDQWSVIVQGDKC